MKTKCYGITDYGAEVTVLVWAKNPSKAKTTVFGSSCWFDGTDYIELKAKRYPQFDGIHGNGYFIDDTPTEEDLRLMREDGWYEYDGNMEPCSVCGLHEWYGVPESKMEDGVCEKCRNGGQP